jgi:hypothetical protein
VASGTSHDARQRQDDIRPVYDSDEASVQAAIVTHLATSGWQILAVADTLSREHGIDIVARKGDQRLLVEAKGYPGSSYANRSREGRPIAPAAQARTYFAGALMKALMLMQDEPGATVSLGLPSVTTYRNLVDRTRIPLSQLGVRLFWVLSDGTVEETDFEAHS